MDDIYKKLENMLVIKTSILTSSEGNFGAKINRNGRKVYLPSKIYDSLNVGVGRPTIFDLLYYSITEDNYKEDAAQKLGWKQNSFDDAWKSFVGQIKKYI